MNLQDLTIEQKEWAAKNPGIVRAVVANAADRAIAEVRAREKRRHELLTRAYSFDYVGRSGQFSFTDDFAEKGKALVSASVSFVSPLFRDWFFPKIESDVPAAELVISDICPGSNNSPYATEPEIRERLGAAAEIRLAHFCYVLENAWLNPYRFYACYAKDAKGVLRKVNALRGEEGWSIYAVQTGYHDELRNGIRVVSLPY